jgi:hypothetical protein
MKDFWIFKSFHSTILFNEIILINKIGDGEFTATSYQDKFKL